MGPGQGGLRTSQAGLPRVRVGPLTQVSKPWSFFTGHTDGSHRPHSSCRHKPPAQAAPTKSQAKPGREQRPGVGSRGSRQKEEPGHPGAAPREM